MKTVQPDEEQEPSGISEKKKFTSPADEGSPGTRIVMLTIVMIATMLLYIL